AAAVLRPRPRAGLRAAGNLLGDGHRVFADVGRERGAVQAGNVEADARVNAPGPTAARRAPAWAASRSARSARAGRGTAARNRSRPDRSASPRATGGAGRAP